jgi:acetyltransferase-like isoleucine patch superfamily enzyme/coenzyme F420-reducing hydrogenase beta subunit
MIDIKNKVDCCGCNACGDVCPTDSISFKADQEGIWYPEVDMSKCIDCHLCEKVCPIINHDGLNKGNSDNPTTYVLQHKSAKERFNSTSGCLYPEIARYYLEHGWYVAGHIFNKDYTVRGNISNKIEDLEIFRNSKYLQSDMQGVYKEVKKLLNEGKRVLFSGCPCQVAAFKTYLRKDYLNLLTTDFTCMGIDSPKAFLKYIESLEHKYGSKVAYFKSKSKEVGWRDLTNKFIFENGKTYFGINGRDANLKATFLDILDRPSCYDCKFKGMPRIADITIGDFWHRPSKEFAEIDDNTGTSYYIANNEKGVELFKHISDSFRFTEIDVKLLFEGNPRIFSSLDEPKYSRDEFYKRLETEDFQKLVDEYYERTHKRSSIKALIINSLRALKRQRLNPIAFTRFFYYNFFCSNVKANIATGDILLFQYKSKLSFAKDSKLTVVGICQIGNDCKLKLGENAKMSIDNFDATSGNIKINIAKDAALSIAFRTVIDNNVSITCSKKVQIGGFSYISSGVIIDDSNNKVVCSNDNSFLSEPVKIGEHCLLGENVVIRRGTQMGDEVIVESNSTVSGSIPPRVKIAGTPATIVKKDVLWKR